MRWWCEKNIALELIEYLDKENCDVGILGGDVYLIRNSVPESLCDNWASDFDIYAHRATHIDG